MPGGIGSGVVVNQDCFDEFELMKQKKVYYGIVYKLSTDLKTIEIDKKFENPTFYDGATIAAEYKKFSDYLLSIEEDKECRYACYDIRWSTTEGIIKTKIVFITFCPENARVKLKMVYSSSKDTLKSPLQAVIDVQANDASDLTLEHIVSKCQSNTTYG